MIFNGSGIVLTSISGVLCKNSSADLAKESLWRAKQIGWTERTRKSGVTVINAASVDFAQTELET
jgi:hypothetical protein